MEYIFLSIGLIAVIVFNVLRKPKVTLNIVIVKGIASLCFVFTALFSFINNPDCPDYTGAFVIVGMIFGLVGDIVLDLKYVYVKDRAKYLKIGFSCFLIGHIFYIASIISCYGFRPYPIMFGALCFPFGILFASFARTFMKLKYGKYKRITTLYTAIINTTFGLVFAYAVSEPSAHTIIFTIGMFLFFVSDAILSRTYFSPDKKKRKNRTAIVCNHVFYFVAQYLIASSLIFLRG